MIRLTTVSKAVLLLVSVGVAAPVAHAARFAQKHPRRAEVNARERNQKRRINQGVKNGTMTKEEAHQERQDLRNIKREERAEVKANGGHLTKSEQKDLNHQLNQNSKDIYGEKHDGSAPAPAAPAAEAPVAQ